MTKYDLGSSRSKHGRGAHTDVPLHEGDVLRELQGKRGLPAHHLPQQPVAHDAARVQRPVVRQVHVCQLQAAAGILLRAERPARTHTNTNFARVALGRKQDRPQEGSSFRKQDRPLETEEESGYEIPWYLTPPCSTGFPMTLKRIKAPLRGRWDTFT